jgi:amino acid adenylation domain-containing protein
MDDINKRLAALSPKNRALLALALQKKGAAFRSFPVSFAQQRLWFLDQLEPASSIYNINAALRLVGRLDLVALEQTVTMIIQRHAVLRTIFAVVDGQPVQVIAPAARRAHAARLPVIDLAALPAVLREPTLQRLGATLTQQPFDLARGPLLRVHLLRLQPDTHVLVFCVHHIVADGWSAGVFVQELAALYPACLAHAPSPLPPPPLQYADYAVWQRQWLQGELLERQLAYWRTQLADAPALALLTDYPYQPRQTFHGAQQSYHLSAELSASLYDLSRQAGVTLFMLLLAAWQVLLARYSGQDDFVVGTPIAGRTRGELEGLIGLFVNTLALRAPLAGNPSFRALLARVRELTLAAFAHQDAPFEQVLDALQLTRDPQRAPLFQVMFVLQNAPQPTLELPGLRLQSLEFPTTTARFELTFVIMERADGLSLQLEYNTDLFAAATITRMLGNYATLLAGSVANPDQVIADLPLLTPAERRQLLVEWNATAQPFPHDVCIHDLIAAQAARTPDAIAVHFEDQQVSYRELDQRADRLAWHLLAIGVMPGACIAICMERSIELVAGILGIFKAGGAYAPLDPAYPPSRLSFMLADTQAPVLITQPHLLDTLPAHSARVICLDARWDTVAQSRDLPLPRRAAPEQLAYVIYTSGSTGQPKGVMVRHQGLVNLTLAFRAILEIQHADRFLVLPSFSFDASLGDIFPILIGGAVLVLHRAPSELGGIELLQFCEQRQITHIDIPAAFWQQWVSDLSARPERNLLPGLRLLLVGGERSMFERLEAWDRLTAHPVTFVNGYGPTEATVGTAMYKLAGDAARTPSATLPIGRPIANVQVYVLDRSRQPVPVGVAGELYIGGVGVSWGYLHQPALTATQFIPDSFSAVPGTRLYRTGDLVRYLADGQIEILGRQDQQVKLRGFRIELSEIEAVLNRHPAVHTCAVIVQTAENATPRLVAYVVPPQDDRTGTIYRAFATNEPAPATLASDLRGFLQQHLPEYMVPAAIMMLDALPLTPNGKLDRKALPTLSAVALAEPIIPPSTPGEELLATLWHQLLGDVEIGRASNFFTLGGHSLLATQLSARVRDAFQVDLPLRTLFEAPTLAALADRIDALSHADLPPPAPPIRPIPHTTPPPLAFAQQRLWFLDQYEPASAAYNICSALRLVGQLDLAALAQSFSTITQRHAALRTRIGLVDSQPVQLIAPAAPRTLPLLDLQALPAARQQPTLHQLGAALAQQPFDLARGPLLRLYLLRLHPTEHVLLLNVHHIVADGWSVGVFVRELAALYPACLAHAPSPLPALPIQYADYALWQRQWLRGAVLERQLAYWRTQLAAAPELELPTDYPRPPRQTFHGTQQVSQLSAELSAGLAGLGHQLGITPFMLLLTAWQALLARYSGQDDFVIGTPIAGRTRGELEDVIGLFVNTLALRSRLAGNPRVRDVLAQVRSQTLDAFSHQDVPFEQVLEALQLTRDLRRPPLFQVMFTLQNVPQTVLELPGLRLQSLEFPTNTAKFELALTIMERAEGLHLRMEYNTDLFAATTITRMLGQYAAVLAGIAANPALRLAELPLLTPAEHQQILHEWNATQRRYAETATIPELFAAQVQRTPAAVAVVSAGQHLTYAELNHRANQLAQHLRTLGVGPEVAVGICVERSLTMMIGIMGILKAGGAYLPLDPAYPAERLAFTLDDAQVSVLLTQASVRARLPQQPAHVICLDDDWPRIACARPVSPISGVSADQLAYIIYTSGSTGQPKGVLITQRAVNNFISSINAIFAVTARDRVLQFATFCFDVSIFEIFTALLNGAPLCLVDQETLLSPPALTDLLYRQRISMFDIPPTMLNLLPADALPDVRIMFIGIEKFTGELVNRWVRPGRRFFNGYGPTEATCAMTIMDCVGHYQQSPPIGRPMPNHQVYLLDRWLQPVPVGVTGQLYTGGVGLARGYLNRPALTAERFVPNPFAGHRDKETGDKEPPLSAIGTRLYATGDLARYLPDGNIEFLGRVDHQVKLRGYRIELGEITAALQRHPTVRESVVLAREDAAGEKQIVAYIVPAQAAAGLVPEALIADPQSLIPELRDFLRQQLPGYMVPAAFVLLAALPMTPSGKLDRKALPKLDHVQPSPREAYVAPRTPLEQFLATIWQAILSVDSSIHDNFFELGGNSIQAAILINKLRAALSETVPVIALFESPTIAELASHLVTHYPRAIAHLFDTDRMIDDIGVLNGGERQRPASFDASAGAQPQQAVSPLVALQSRGTRPPFFCVHPASGDVVNYALLARLLGANQPFYGLRAYGLMGDLPDTRIEAMATHYLAAVREIQPHGPYVLGGWSSGGVVAFEMAQQLHQQGETTELVALFDSLAVYYFNQPPLENIDDTTLLAEFVRDISGSNGQALAVTADELRPFGPDEQLQLILDRAQGLGLPPEIDLPQVRQRWDVYRANSQALRSYVPQLFPGTLTLFRAAQQPEDVADPTLGWSAFAADMTILEVPGTHTTLLTPPHVRILAAQLKTCLDSAHSAPIHQDSTGVAAMS